MSEDAKTAGQWARFDEFRVVSNLVYGVGSPSRYYDPLLHPEVVREFAKLKEGDEAGLLDFVRRWGLLGGWDWHGGPPQKKKKALAADPLSWVWGQVKNVRLAVEIQLLRQSGDTEGLRDLLEADRPRDAGPADDLIMTITGTDWTPHPENFSWEEPAGMAEAIIAKIINLNLDAQRYAIQVNPLRLVPYSPNLLSAIYWHLSKVVTQGLQLERCENCSVIFQVTDRRQRFCPRPAHLGPGESSCALAARKRRQRQSKTGGN